jgi:hypothetical protein
VEKAEKAERERLAAIKAARGAKKKSSEGGKKGKKVKGEAEAEAEAEAAPPLALADGAAAEAEAEAEEAAAPPLDLSRRGALTQPTKKGITVFHLAAEMPRTRPDDAVVVRCFGGRRKIRAKREVAREREREREPMSPSIQSVSRCQADAQPIDAKPLCLSIQCQRRLLKKY